MEINLLPPKKTINKAYLKQKVGRSNIETLKSNLKKTLYKINENEREEHLKNVVSDFLKDTWYKDIYEINTKDNKDLVIHTGTSSKDPVGVIIEVKKPTNKNEMIGRAKTNVKALHELILYYLKERTEIGNVHIKHLIITNIYEWYVFDAVWFEKNIFRNTKLRKDYESWRLSGNDTKFFYEDIAKPFLDNIEDIIDCAYFDFRDFSTILEDDYTDKDNKLIDLYKILSPPHLLKQPFTNDSNNLDKNFYSELLYILGLEEQKSNNKKIITRRTKKNNASLIENIINKLNDRDSLRNINNVSNYGDTNDDRLFNIALELCITWINRVLFLKLLESQLIKYHRGSRDYLFLNSNVIYDFDELSNLFFQVLAEKPINRRKELQDKYNNVPYLNSSLFERTYLELAVLDISGLDNRLLFQLSSSTVLKDELGKRRTGKSYTLDYLFQFLDAYDFSSDGAHEIQEENKSLINASVLGLIFEKINGYKNGSFFTPGAITMFMCKEVIRRTIIQKFNSVKNWECTNLSDIYNLIDDKKEANTIINSVTLCDPAVGSGHFLVSALNEIIAIKSELKILLDNDGKTLRDYQFEVVNDELVIVDDDGTLYEYKPNSKESQRVQETIFHEKETIIENCLFGVDLNPNSVKICRLRLWIELLKHAYYTEESAFKYLETLPNIDINIKIGNSLINRFELNDSLKSAFKNINYTIKDYKRAVKEYKTTNSKEKKLQLLEIIEEIKNAFRDTLEDSFKDKISKARGKVINYETEINTQKQWGNNNISEVNAKLLKARKALRKIEEVKREVLENVIYSNAFEWRFEFPEILDDNDKFIGFDIVIGNPPYGNLLLENSKNFFKDNYSSTQGPFEVYKFFVERGLQLLSPNGHLCYISPDTWTSLSYFKKLRTLVFTEYNLIACTETLYDIFSEATVDTSIYIIKNELPKENTFTIISSELSQVGTGSFTVNENDAVISLKVKPEIIKKIENNTFTLDNIIEVWRGMSAYGAKSLEKPYNSFVKETANHRPLLNGGDIGKYMIKWSGEYINYGKWLHRPRPSYIYDQPHLLIQRIRNPRLKDRLVGTYDAAGFISSDGLSNLLLKKGNNDVALLKAVLALINSKLINFWFSFYFFDVNIKPEQIRQIPITQSINKAKGVLSTIVDYILFINELDDVVHINEYVSNKHIVNQFEEVLDALIMELYLKEYFEAADIFFNYHAAKIFPSINNYIKEEALIAVHEAYQDLRQKDNVIRNNLKLMDIRLSNIINTF